MTPRKMKHWHSNEALTIMTNVSTWVLHKKHSLMILTKDFWRCQQSKNYMAGGKKWGKKGDNILFVYVGGGRG